jgi:hypothetical protein
MVEMTGKLWYDTSKGKRTIAECIQAAKASYRRGFGEEANVCYINPNYRTGAPDVVDGVQLKRDRHISPNYYWIGRNGADIKQVEPEPPTPLESHLGYYQHCPGCGVEQIGVNERCMMCRVDLQVEAAT